MEAQEILKAEVGEKEIEKLKPEIVEVKEINVVEVGERKIKKFSFAVKHPGKEELIHISEVKYEREEKLKLSGLWVNLEKDKDKKETNKLQKGSAISILIETMNVKTAEELIGKEIETSEGEMGYLCFKCY